LSSLGLVNVTLLRCYLGYSRLWYKLFKAFNFANQLNIISVVRCA